MVNTGCTFVGFNRIALGKRGLIASDVRIYTARYPVGLDERLTPVGIPEGSDISVILLPCRDDRDGGWIGGGALSCRESLSVKVVLSGPEVSLPKIFRPIVLFLPDDT